MQNMQQLKGSLQGDFLLSHLKILVTTIVVLLVSGCASDKFGSTTRDETTAPTSLPAGPVALIISAATAETVQALENYNRYYKSGFTAGLYASSIRQAYVDTSDPELSVATVTQMLEARFGKVQRFSSFEQASRSGFKLIAKLDMQTRLINNRASDPASYLALDFYRADQRHLGTVKSSSRRTLTPVWTGYKREKEIVSDIRQQGEIQAHALELLRQKLARVPVES